MLPGFTTVEPCSLPAFPDFGTLFTSTGFSVQILRPVGLWTIPAEFGGIIAYAYRSAIPEETTRHGNQQ